MPTQVEYTLVPGHPWERLIIARDKRTRRIRRLESARSTMKLQGSSEYFVLTPTITSEGGVMLTIPYDDTLYLTAGTWDFDVVGDYRGYDEQIAVGTIEVSALSTITPLGSGTNMYITYQQFTDFRRVFTWQDTDGTTLTVQDGRLQAKDTQGSIVLDLSFFSEAPDEATIALMAGEERGYLAPFTGASLEMHISDQNTIAAGTYTFDLLAQETGGDWGRVAEGTLVVDASITDPSSP